jgi:hypothetical protein
VLARLARVLIAAALLAGSQTALVHPLEHSDDGRLVHLGGTSSEKSELCDVLAALGACVPTAILSFGDAAPSRPGISTSQLRPRAAEAPPFFAQGPPALL